MTESARNPTDIVNLKLRLREDMRAKLEAQAKEDGMSLNAEIISRLQSTFDDDRRGLLEAALLSGVHNARIVRGISALLVIADPGEEWNNNKSQRIAVRFCINRVLDALMPMPDDISGTIPETDQEAAQRFSAMLSVTNEYLRRVTKVEGKPG